MSTNTSENLATASKYPVLEELLPDQLAALERIVAKGQQGKHKGDPGLAQGRSFHLNKAERHIRRTEMSLTNIDHDTEEPHLLLTVVRLMFAHKCALREDADKGAR